MLQNTVKMLCYEVLSKITSPLKHKIFLTSLETLTAEFILSCSKSMPIGDKWLKPIKMA